MRKIVTLSFVAVLAIAFASEAVAKKPKVSCQPRPAAEWISLLQITDKAKAMGYDVWKVAKKQRLLADQGLRQERREHQGIFRPGIRSAAERAGHVDERFSKALRLRQTLILASCATLEENDEDLKKLRTWLEKIRKLDFHGASLGDEAGKRLAQCEALLDHYAQQVFDAQAENRPSSRIGKLS